MHQLGECEEEPGEAQVSLVKGRDMSCQTRQELRKQCFHGFLGTLPGRQAECVGTVGSGGGITKIYFLEKQFWP